MHMQDVSLVAPVDPADHALGMRSAPVTVIQYGDFQCPNCKKAAGAVKLMLARFDPCLRFVFRHYPLEGVHAHALRAAELAECAAAQGRFWPMHDLLFEHQPDFGRERLLSLARDLDLDLSRLVHELDSHAHLQRVREHQRGARASGVRATPTFFVNGKLHDVSYGMRALFVAVAAELISPEKKTPSSLAR